MSRSACLRRYVVMHEGHSETLEAASPESAAEVYAELYELAGVRDTEMLRVRVAGPGKQSRVYAIDVIPLYRARRLDPVDAAAIGRGGDPA